MYQTKYALFLAIILSSSVAYALRAGGSGGGSGSGGGGGTGYVGVRDEGNNLVARSTINFIGAGITCADNAGTTVTDCTVTSSGGGAMTPGSTDYVTISTGGATQGGAFKISSGTVNGPFHRLQNNNTTTTQSDLATVFLPNAAIVGKTGILDWAQVPVTSAQSIYAMVASTYTPDANPSNTFTRNTTIILAPNNNSLPGAIYSYIDGVNVFNWGPTSLDFYKTSRYFDADGSNFVADRSSGVVSADFTIVKPSVAGTVGQVRTISNIDGTDVYEEWKTPSASGGGGSSTLAVSSNNVIVSSPTSNINFMPPFIVALQGSTSSQVTLNSSSVTLQGVLSAASPVTLTAGVFGVNCASASCLGQTIDVSGAEITGQLAATNFPVLTGDVTSAGGSLVMTVARAPALSLMAGNTSYAAISTGPTVQAGAILIGSGTIVQFAASTITLGSALPSALATNPLKITGNENSFYQANIMNRSNGASASSDWVATNDLGSDTSGYVNMGINSSGYVSAAYDFTQSSGAYIYSSDRDLAIFTQGAGPDAWLRFGTGGSRRSNERMYITNTGIVAIPGTQVAIAGSTYTWSAGLGGAGQFLQNNNGTITSATPAGGGASVNISSGPTFASTNTVTVTNTTTESSLRGAGYGSSTITANGFYVGETFLIQANGVFSTDSLSPGTVNIKLKVGGSTIAITGAFTPDTSVASAEWRLIGYATVRTLGATGSIIVNTSFEIPPNGVTLGKNYAMPNATPITLDTTKAVNDFDLTVTWGTADTDNILTCTNFTVDNFNGNGGGGGSGTGDMILASTQTSGGAKTWGSYTTFNGSVTVNNTSGWTLSNSTFVVTIATSIVQQNASGSSFLLYQSTQLFNLADLTTASNTLGVIPGYQWQCAPLEVFGFDASLLVTGITNGTQYGINGPTGSTTTMVVMGNTSAVGTYSMSAVTALNTADAVAMVTSNGTALVVNLRGTLQCSATAGSVSLMWKSVTNANTSTIKAGSWASVNRIQ